MANLIQPSKLVVISDCPGNDGAGYVQKYVWVLRSHSGPMRSVGGSDNRLARGIPGVAILCGGIATYYRRRGCTMGTVASDLR